MPRFHTVTSPNPGYDPDPDSASYDPERFITKDVPFTAAEEAARDAEAAAALAAKPMEGWKAEMAKTDKDMPRWLEDHIEAAHGGVAGNAFQQSAYDVKKTVRARRPV